MKKIALMSLVASSVLMAGGWKIPETSLNGVALSAANIAHNKSADAAYYNPANMVFMADEDVMEVDLMYIGLEAPNYKGTVGGTGPYDLNAKKENFLVPSVHYVSGKAGEARIGLSIVSPGGLSKRWDMEPAKTSAEEFTLQIIEINPTVAIPLGDKVSVAAGFRILHSSGVVKSSGTVNLGAAAVVTRNMEGDSIDYGYNFALAYKPTSDLEMGLTYRSKVDLTIEGDAYLNSSSAVPALNATYGGSASVTVPLPAAVSLAAAYTFASETTIELVYERNFWSAYKNIDFDYNGNEGPLLGAIFGGAIPKAYVDTNAFRLGITQDLDKLRLMGGVVYDESPVPTQSLDFSLPDSDSISVSLGGRYEVTDSIEIGLSALYSMRESRKITAQDANINGLVGEFSNSNVLIISTGVSYKF